MPVIYHKNVMYGGGSGGGGASAISDLTDVELTNLADGQILKYDATNQKWVNDDESGGGVGYSRTALYTNPITSAGEVTLSDDISNYDSILFIVHGNANGASIPVYVDTAYILSCVYSTNVNSDHVLFSMWGTEYIRMTAGTANNKLNFFQFSAEKIVGIYGIKFGGGGSESRDKYSTEETVIGEWIDGKPIYRLVITPWINGTLQTGYTYANNILSVSPFNNRNVKDIVNCRLLSPRNGTSGGYTDVMVSNYSSASGNNDVIVPNTDGTIWIKSLSDGQNRSVIVILEYTKTTD